MLHCAIVAHSESSGAEFGRPWFNMRRNVFGVSETTNWSDGRVTVLLARVEDLVPGWRRRTDILTCLCNMKRMTTKTWRPRTTQLEIRSGHLLPNCGGLAADLLKVSKSTACVLLPSGACQPKRPGIPWHFCQPLNPSLVCTRTADRNILER